MTILASDSLNRTANATSLGTTDSYAGGTAKPWVVLGTAVYGIDANGYAYCSTKATSGHGAAYLDTGNADGSITATIRNVAGDYPKLAFRISDAENFLFLEHQIDANQVQLRKYVGGSGTTISTKSGLTLTASDTVKITASGSTITVYLNGTLIITATDTFNQAATKWGFNSYNYTNARFDNFIVEDLNVGGTGATITGIAATATADTIAPAVTSQQQVNISSVIASITADALNPSLRTDNTTTSVIAVALADAVNPSVGVSGNANIITLIADMTADAINPSLSIDNAIQSVVGSAIADALAPSVGSFTNISIDAVIASATADGTNLSVDAVQNISIQMELADAIADVFVPNLVGPLSVQITSVIAEVMADALAPSFYQLWKEWSLDTVLFTEKISETDNLWYPSIPLNLVPFTDTSQSVNAKWRDTEKTVNSFK